MQTFAEVQAASSAAYRTLGDLEWEVESTTVTGHFMVFVLCRTGHLQAFFHHKNYCG